MLRITEMASTESVSTIKLEGKLLDPWVGEVRKACAAARVRSGRTRLDLAAVTFVDAAGVDLLRELIRQGVEIAACSGYVAEILQGEQLAPGPVQAQPPEPREGKPGEGTPPPN